MTVTIASNFFVQSNVNVTSYFLECNLPNTGTELQVWDFGYSGACNYFIAKMEGVVSEVSRSAIAKN